jgi:hypothetical protein
MQTQITIPVGTRPVTVHELSVGQIRAWLRGEELKAVAGHAPESWDAAIDVDGVSLTILYATTDLAPADLDEHAPSQMAALVKAVREANPSFFALADRITAAQTHLHTPSAAGDNSASSLNATSTPSFVTATPTHGSTPTSPSNPPSLN